MLSSAGLLTSEDVQFHWHNRGYTSFEDFLEQFTAEKRKKARRDRRRVAEMVNLLRRQRIEVGRAEAAITWMFGIEQARKKLGRLYPRRAPVAQDVAA